MAPGMAHCFGGPGPNQFDMLTALDRWVEARAAPERVIASKPDNPLAALAGLQTKSLRTRPLCAWPKQARWTGTGSTDDAANFRCEAQK
jgi:feruloyl esterase